VTAAAIGRLDPATYRRHPLHAEDRAWVEKNCYIDIWIEVLHAHQLDPLAMLAFTLAVDFEDDQWTFFKPPHGELWDLYGVDVQELTVWRPLLDHCVSHLAAGKLVSTEADAFYLPDTKGTDYRTAHTKTTIVIQDVDVEQRRLGYFHNASYHVLDGDDFSALFRLGVAPDPAFMPLYAELIRVDRLRRFSPEQLRVRSAPLLVRHVRRRPAQNPLTRFAQRFSGDILHLQEQGLARYHAYAFATIRQLGAAFELASSYLSWLEPSATGAVGGAAEAFLAISTTAKALILKGARAVNAKRPTDFLPMLAEAAAAWDRGFALLDEHISALDLDSRPRDA
jgi:hypothetical protein